MDDLTGLMYKVRTKYMFGADGARSRVASGLDLPMDVKPGGGLAINILVKADLSHLIRYREGNLHWIMQPETEHPDFAKMAIVRMVRPWVEWMFILLPSAQFDGEAAVSNDEYAQRVRELIGDDTPIEILNVSRWYINETAALEYSKGKM